MATDLLRRRSRGSARPYGGRIGRIDRDRRGYPDGSRRIADIAALIVKLSPDGGLVFEKQFAEGTETAEGVTVASDKTIYVAGTTTSFGAGTQDAFVLHLQPTGKKALGAVTWGGTGFETGAGVAVNGARSARRNDHRAATVLVSRCIRQAIGAEKTVPAVEGELDDVAGVVTDPGPGAATPDGSTTYGGNFEAALVRIAR